VTYCDTSFLLALYVPRDFFCPYALKIAAKFTDPIPYTLLGELELHNGVHRAFAAKAVSPSEYAGILRQISQDEADGFFIRTPLNQINHFAKARDLSKRYTPTMSSRTLDILHVAAALLIDATAFVSFDRRQRTLAGAARLGLVPRTLPKK
jgi:predicted nucleic acid-binding protein